VRATAAGSAIGLFCLALLTARPAHGEILRVCADPNNLPFSDQSRAGFENKIIALIAKDLNDTIRYTWWAQRRGYARNTIKADLCDVWAGIASNAPMMASTRPYYRSGYVFVTKTSRDIHIASLDDPQLHTLRIGVQMVGDDATNTPPAHALARRGIVPNVRGFMLYGDYTQPHPPSAIIDAVASNDIDVAIAWGPMAGYFAAREPAPLSLTPVEPTQDGAQLPMNFDISMGVRFGENVRLQRLNDCLQRNHAAIDAILAEYHVPLLPEPFAVPD